MVVLTIIFLTMSLFTLFRGRLFRDFHIKITEENIKLNTIENYKYDSGLLMRAMLFIVYGFVLMIVQIVYLSNALQYDIYKYPTVIMLFLVVYGILKPLFMSKKKQSFDEESIKKHREKAYKNHTFTSVARNLTNIAYYAYMLYLLVI